MRLDRRFQNQSKNTQPLVEILNTAHASVRRGIQPQGVQIPLKNPSTPPCKHGTEPPGGPWSPWRPLEPPGSPWRPLEALGTWKPIRCMDEAEEPLQTLIYTMTYNIYYVLFLGFAFWVHLIGICGGL